MKKLRIVFAVLLALVLVCATAFAEVDTTEAVEEAVLEAAATESTENTETTETTGKTEGIKDTETTEDTTQSKDGNGEEHTTTGDPNTTKKYSYQLHEGEKVTDIDALIAGKAGSTVTIGSTDFTVYQAYNCKTGTAGIYRFPCMLGKTDPESGDPIWHEFIVPAEHKWASEQHEIAKDWGIKVVEATCTEKGKAQDYCIVCGTTREKYRDIDPMGHSYENVDDLRVNVTVVTEPSCIVDKNNKPVKDGKLQVTCVVCGKVLDTIAIDRDDMNVLKTQGKDLTDSTSVNAWLTKNKYTFTWFNKEEFQVKYHNWISHKWDKWITDVAPTCATEGEEVRYCKVCATKVSRTIPALTADYVMVPEMTKVLDCYHEAQVWQCSLCKGTCEDHPNIIKVRKVTTHTIDTRIKAMIDAAVADPSVTKYEYNGEVVYEAPDCTKAGYVFYVCEHADDKHNTQLKEADVLAAYNAKDAGKQASNKTNELYKAGKTYYIMWTGDDLETGTTVYYDEETETKITFIQNNYLHGTDTIKVVRDQKITVSKELDDVDLIKYYQYDNHEWDSSSYKKNILDGYTHKGDTTDVAGKKAYRNTNTKADSYEGKVIPALGHDWSAWIERYKVDEGGAGNEYAYYVRVCNRCGLTQELVGPKTPTCDDTKEEHNWEVYQVTDPTCTTIGQTISKCSKCSELKVTATTPALGHDLVKLDAVAPTTTSTGLTEGEKCSRCGTVTKAQTVIPMVETVPNKYTVDVADVTKSATTTDGTGTIAKIEGNEEIDSLYVRIYWVYTLSDGSSMAYAAVKPVTISGDTMTFDTTSPSAPYGATLDEVQFALVDDAKADRAATYKTVGGTKPVVIAD